MEQKQIEKLKARIENISVELELNRNNKGSIQNDMDLFTERADKEFLLNKRGVNVRLSGNNKYYWGHQFSIFRKNIEKYGTSHFKAINGSEISFHKYSINEKYSQYSNDLWRFDNAEEMKGFVKGYNSMCWILELKEKGLQ
tara:strand:+ start:207 stop:629 length:423 start_codon:yes stop_codon:yes gene_type:complete